MRFSIKIAESRSALYSHSTARRIHENGLHPREVDHQTVVTERTAAYVMPASTNRRQQLVRPSEIDRSYHVSNAGATSDHPGMFADACIPDLARLVVAGIRRFENLALKYRAEGLDIQKGHSGHELYFNNEGCRRQSLTSQREEIPEVPVWEETFLHGRRGH